ncbi:paired amphipathic helix protein Sin3a isoform X6 [Procambarus clarkii]|uniref:paired amphipathic helix protein Sin3a isoform X6 n=1 Tax=Procambarus clarkii TaxID=6728 RepID=UPI00374291E9
MKRRIDDLSGRGEAVSGIVSAGGVAGGLTQGGQGVTSGPGGVGVGPGSYVRGPTITQLGARPGQPTTPAAVTAAAVAAASVGAPVPGVVPVPATTAGQGVSGAPSALDHQPHNPAPQPVLTGYAGGKVEMHTGVHHTLPAYSASLPTAPQPQVSGVGSASVVHQTAAVAAAAAAAAGATQGSGQFQRLKVEDALSYLDQVKLRFGKQPQVYNDFLDIMKEFKSQSIDTPGVIARVSQLFRGHPELIVGFNTFLPPGYKIEVQGNEQVKVSVSVPGQQTTVVHTPQGVHHHITSTHHPPPPPPPTVTVKPSHHPPPPRSPNTAGCTGANGVKERGPIVPPCPGFEPRSSHLRDECANHYTSRQTSICVVLENADSVVRGSALPASVTQHTSPSLVGTHNVHTGSGGSAGPGSGGGSGGTPGGGGGGGGGGVGVGIGVGVGVGVGVIGGGGGGVGGNTSTGTGGGTTNVTQVASSVSVGSNTPTGTNSGSNSNATSNTTGGTQHSTNTAPQHPSREPQPPPPHQHHHHHHQPPAQPVEFNHAINYVNKIKLRFQGQPDIYKQFLEILHTYQKEQRHLKDGGSIPTRTLTETEVYEKVAKLFENQEDLLQEFGQFLPDATNNSAAQAAVSDFMDQYRTHHGGNKTVSNDHTSVKKSNIKSSCGVGSGNNMVSGPGNVPNKTSPMFGHQLKRPHSGPTQGHTHSHAQPPVKKPKLGYLKDMSAAEAGKYATLAEYAFFDKVRKALRHEETYHNFLRCVTLYNEEIVTRSELVQLIHPFLAKFPDLIKWFKEFVGYREGALGNSDIIPSSVAKQERISGDLAMEIDYTTCKRLGASYCALPKSYPQPKCSGRTSLCREVLNDTWVSFPSWSEDSTFVTSRKTQYEEYIYRCEDERFELDVVLETNLATMRVLEGVHKKLQRMSPEEAARFRLDDSLGGNSPTIHQRAIRRIYGDKAPDIIDGLKKNPVVAVPLVLRRLKAKDEEWREAQKGFNKIWREQNEKYYLKSLDHQGITFKQTDVKTIRSKSLLNDIETLFDERHEQAEESGDVITGPHMVLHYPDKSIIDDAANLIIHHVKRQTTYHKDDKVKIKQIVRHFIPDLLFHTRQDMSDDEKDMEDEDEEEEDGKSEGKCESGGRRDLRGRECKQPSSTPCATTNNNSNKRKTRNRGLDQEKDCDTKSVRETSGNNNNNNNNNNKTKDDIKNKIALNGDATEDEKISIKSEVDEDKVEVKEEPGSVGNGNVQPDDEYRLFMCNNNWYLFLRLHQILCCRLTTMYEHAVRIAAEEAKDKKDRKEATAVALRLKPKNEIAIEDYYPAMLDMVKNVLDGNLESTAYEDTLREMFGIHAYTGFTMDKVVTGAVRQLQHLVCDEPPAQCTSMYLSEAKKGGAGGPIASSHRRLAAEQSYQKKSERLLQDENCFKIYTYKRNCRMSVELIDTEIEEGEDSGGSVGTGISHSGTVPSSSHSTIPPAVTEVERWSEYVEKYVSSVAPQMSPAMQAQLSRKPVFLPRNLRSWRKLTASRQTNQEVEKGGCIEDIKPPVCPDMDIGDNTQCKFNLSSFKMVFVVNSDSYMYKKQALKRAKQSHEHVSRRMRSGLLSWHGDWCTRHVSEADQRAATDWFLGHTDGLRPNCTRIVRIDDPSRPPFAPYNKYKCELEESGGS